MRNQPNRGHRRALYIGRFQPFHVGHLDVLQQIAGAADVDEIVLAVGSSQYDHLHKSPAAPWAVNPFTYEERRQAIEASLAGALPKPCLVCPLPDYHDWEKWYQHIVERLPEVACLYTCDDEERRFFAARGKEVRGFDRRFTFHAGTLRRKMADGDQSYRPCLPAATLDALDRMGAAERVRELLRRDRGREEAGSG
jgi:nicotinamide-nucleotide adenylyltransferase